MRPTANMEWPPRDYSPLLARVERDAAWLAGDVERFRGEIMDVTTVRNQQGRGGFLSRLAGRSGGGGGQEQERLLHLGLPFQVCIASADMLVGTPPTITLHEDDRPTTRDDGTEVAGNPRAQAFLEALTGSDMFAAGLHRAFTYSAALGGVYGRVVWNQDVQPGPWIDWADADGAFTEWAWGRPQAITFHDTYPDPGGRKSVVWRLLERHEPGRIIRTLWEGTDTSLGLPRPLDAHPETQHLVYLVDDDGVMLTGIDRITAVHIPNAEGNPLWRQHPQLRNMGMSDIQKGGTSWGVVDKWWTDLNHEFGTARARLLVSEELLDTKAPGYGQVFDMGRHVFALAQGGDADAAGRIEAVQFQLRTTQYLEGIKAARDACLDNVGMSGITMGLDGGPAMTAAEITARSTRTLNTQRGKARHLRAGLSELVTAVIDMDSVLNGYALLSGPVDVSVAQPIQETDLDRAETVKTLRDARAASTHHLVERMHPEWTAAQVEEEVERIRTEEGVVDPFLLGPDEAPEEGFR